MIYILSKLGNSSRILISKTTILIALGLLLASSDAKLVMAQTQVQDSSFGIHQTFPMVLGNNQGVPLSEQIQILSGTGTKWVRHRLRWDNIEPVQGQFDWSNMDEILTLLNQEGLDISLVLRDTPDWAKADSGCTAGSNLCPPDLTHWSNFVFQIVTRYGYQAGGMQFVRNWEMWNEEDSQLMFAGTVDEYFDVLQSGSEAVRSTDPTAKVLMGGVTHKAILNSGNQTNPSWLDQLFAKPGVNDTFDIINFHLYGVVADPETTFVKVNELVSTHGLTQKSIWVTETNPSQVSEQTQADNLKSWHQRIFDQGAERVFYFPLPNWCQINTTLRPAWCDDNVYVTERRIGGLVKAADIRTHTLVFAAYQEMVSGQPTPQPVQGDINGDGVVNILDFQILSNKFGTNDSDSDLNGDGIVNILDFQILSNNFNKTGV